MLKVLVKKQLTEVFRGYFTDRKTGKARSKAGIVFLFILYGVILVGLLGGMFTGMAMAICSVLSSAGMGWLYFDIMAGIAVTLGTFGSVFSTYSGLYLPKDNDFLLSLPVPVRLIIISRLVNVYIIDVMFSGVAFIPALLVWWFTAGATVSNVICGIVMLLIVTLTVLILSCLLGWIVAKISLKLKNKSFITVLISLLFIGLYYFVYFKAQGFISDLIENAVLYGANIRESAYFLYLFGRMGEGDWLSTVIFAAATAALLALVLFILSRSFMRLATSGGVTKKVRYKEKPVRQKTAFGTLLAKEFSRFVSSPNYMLNCGLGVLIIPVLGVLILIKGSEVLDVLGSVFGSQNLSGIIVCAALMTASTMNDMAAPSVSLEGKSLWILQSLPVRPGTVLEAKVLMQILLTSVPVLFASACGAAVIHVSVADRILVCVVPVLFTVFMALFCCFLGVRHAKTEWTTELVPIKQSIATLISIFGGWGFVFLFVVPYLFIGHITGLTLYLAMWTVILSAVSLLLYRWINGKGASVFAGL